MIVKPSYAYGMIVIDVWWYQDNPNNKNRYNGEIQCDLGRSRKLENDKIIIARFGSV